MIHLRLAGGLGNQIFQLLAALKYRRCNETLIVYTGYLSRYKTKRVCDLNKLFNINALNIEFKSTHFIFTSRLSRVPSKYTINDNNFNCIRSSDEVFMDGYFQNNWTVDELKNSAEILRCSLLVEPSFNLKSVIHLRGNDFKDDEEFNVVSESWVLNNFNKYIDKFKYSNIVTDDYHAYEDLICRLNINYNQSSTMIDDFYSILECKYLLSTNSTFAFTAFLLSIDHKSIYVNPGQFICSKKRRYRFYNEVC